MERAAGIEPASLAWKAKVLPLHNARAVDARHISGDFGRQAASLLFENESCHCAALHRLFPQCPNKLATVPASLGELAEPC